MMQRGLLLLVTLLTLTACDDKAADENDADGDGVTSIEAGGTDCDDSDAAVNPLADEVCDGVDNNCDGEVDEGVLLTFYTDADSDGYGNALSSSEGCEPTASQADNPDDCDDGSTSINPDAEEVCDGVDNDCNDEIDEAGGDTYYTDADGDGYGDPDAAVLACEQPEDAVVDSTDCDDSSSAAYPGADEYCNGADDDCNGTADDNPVDPSTFYTDADSDGYGDPKSITEACDQPSGTVTDDSDCDDSDKSINPDAEDGKDGVDQDCDGKDGFAFTEDFDAYTAGDYIADNSIFFETWTTGGEGGSEDVPVSDELSYSGDHSLRFDDSEGDDLVMILGPAAGTWMAEWYIYVDTGAYFNLQGVGTPWEDWQKEVHIDGDGVVYDDNESTGTEIAVGQWVLVEYQVDIDNYTQELYFDSTLVISDTFTGSQMGGIDFYPTTISDDQDSAVFFIDDVALYQVK